MGVIQSPLTDKLLLAPELLVPCTQPRGSVRVNSSVLPVEQTLLVLPSIDGTRTRSNVTGEVLHTADNFFYTSNAPRSNNKRLTIVIHAMQTAIPSTGNVRYFEIGGYLVGGGFGAEQQAGSNENLVCWTSTFNVIGDRNWLDSDVGVPHVYVAVLEDATIRLYRDGGLIHSGAAVWNAPDTGRVAIGGSCNSLGLSDRSSNWACGLFAASFGYAAPHEQALALSLDPYSVLEPVASVAIDVGGSAAMDLSGAGAGQSTAVGALTTSIPFAGVALGVATVNGVLSSSIRMAGAAAVTANGAGSLTASIPLLGTAIAQAVAAAALITAIPLAGGAAGQSGASGDLTTGSGMSGAAAGQSGAAGDLTIQIRLNGAALAQALASGDLTAPASGLSGSAAARAAAAGALTTNIPFAGAALVTSSGTGGLSTIIPLAGAAVSISNVIGSLDIQLTLRGDAVAQALAGGDLTAKITFDGAAVAQAYASGAITIAPETIVACMVFEPSRREMVFSPSLSQMVFSAAQC